MHDGADTWRSVVRAIEAGKATIRLDALLAVLSAVGLQLRLERGHDGLVRPADS